MHVNECNIDNPEWNTRIELAVRAAFRKVNFAPTQTDIDTTTNSLRIALAKPLEREEGRREWTSSYLRRTAWFKVLTCLAERLEKTKEVEPLLSLDALSTDEDGEREGETRMNLHPLYGGVLLGLDGDLDDQLRSAPYEVRFDKDEPEISMYRRNPYAIPSFHIVKGASAIRANWRNGQALRLGHDEITYRGRRSLDFQKSRYAVCLKRALPQYMNWLGVQSLKGNDHKVLSLINREHLGDAEARKVLKMAPSSFHDAMGRLTRYGFEDTTNYRKERILHYNPVLDSTQRYTSVKDRSKIMSMSVSEVLEESQHLFDFVADSTSLGPEEVLRLAANRRIDVMMAKVSLDAYERHDERLRRFIRLAVEEPVLGKRVSLPTVEGILRSMPKKQARELVFRSLRYQLPITEVLSLSERSRIVGVAL